jgi:uncharacterized membrane protein YfcA
MSGAIAQWRKGQIDLKMAMVMTIGGVLGTGVGVWLFGVLRRAGQMDLAVSAAYVVLLGAIGTIMLRESLSSLRAARTGASALLKLKRHNWIHGLPFKDRFPASRLYISVLAPAGLGFAVGALSAIMGIGGGFLLVPAMIYVLRMPTNLVMGTSLAQIIAITATATVLQSASNHAVDAMLAAFLIVGGVLGAQFGVRASSRLRGEQLRFLLAVVVLSVGLVLLYGLVARPADLFSVTLGAG